ncbi:MAG: ABC transporter permease [Monoglobales bacterium]
MKSYFILIQLEVKRALKRLGYLYLGMAALLILAGAAAFFTGRLAYGDKVSERIVVGVVLPEDDRLAGKAMSMAASLESVGSLCDFVTVDEKTAEDGLENGEFYAVMKIPEGLVESIMDGTNLPVRVVFPGKVSAEGRIFRELTEAGAVILGSAQAGIYAGDQVIRTAGEGMGLSPEKRQEAVACLEQDLNERYLSYSLAREDCFFPRKVSATGDLDMVSYYGISAFILVLLLMAVPVSGYLMPWNEAMKSQLTRAGIGGGKRVLARMAGLGCLFVLAAVPVWLLYGLSEGSILTGNIAGNQLSALWRQLICVCFVCAGAAALAVFLFEASGSLLGGMMLLFLTAAAQHFLAGGFLPLVFLPETVRRLAPFLPSGILMDIMKTAVTGVWNVSAIIRLILMLAVCLAGSCMLEVREK